MSFLNNLFGGNNENFNSDFWKNIMSETDLDNAVKESFEKKVVIFKHSTRCFISKTVLRNFEKEVAQKGSANISFYFLDLLAHRSISNKIASEFGIEHQSPQMIVLENGTAVKNASHQSISLSLV